jgi:LEA14-like dessication related protein
MAANQPGLGPCTHTFVRRRAIVPAGLLIVLVLASCSVRRPQVSFANVLLGQVRLDGGRLDLLLDIQNPNNWTIDLQALTYTVVIDDVTAASGETETRIAIPAGDCATVVLPVDVTWGGIGRGARELLGGELEYRVNGVLTVGTRVGTFRWPYDRRSRFAPLEVRPDGGGARRCGQGRPS